MIVRWNLGASLALSTRRNVYAQRGSAGFDCQASRFCRRIALSGMAVGRCMRGLLLGLSAAISVVGATLPGSLEAADLKSGVTAAELRRLLETAGLQAEIIDDATRGVGAVASDGDVNFTVRALNCQGAPRSCSTLMFFADFDLGRRPAAKDFDAVNTFNDGAVFGRAYVRPAANAIGVDYVVELDGGVTEEHLSKNVSRWRKVVADFLARLRAQSPSS